MRSLLLIGLVACRHRADTSWEPPPPVEQPVEPAVTEYLAESYDAAIYGGVEGGVVGGIIGDGDYGSYAGSSLLAALDSQAYGGIGLSAIGADDVGYTPDGYADADSYVATEVFYSVASVDVAIGYARDGAKVAARNALWTTLRSNPHDPDARALWTMLTGESELVLLGKLVEVHATDAYLWGALGDLRMAAGKRAEAIAAWQEAARLDTYSRSWPTRLEMAKATATGAK